MTVDFAKEYLLDDCADCPENKNGECMTKSHCFEVKRMAIQALEQEPCEDCVSRKAVLEYIEGSDAELGHSSENEIVCQDIKELPSVTPIHKKGKWIITNDYLTAAYGSIDYVKCSCCGEESLEEGDYCPNCGAEMEGEEESK